MRNLRLLTFFAVLMALPLAAQTTYILTASPSNVQGIIDRHGLTVVREIFDGTNCVLVVNSPLADVSGVETEVDSDLSSSACRASGEPWSRAASTRLQCVVRKRSGGPLESGLAAGTFMR